jgi:hypothetical protein
MKNSISKIVTYLFYLILLVMVALVAFNIGIKYNNKLIHEQHYATSPSGKHNITVLNKEYLRCMATNIYHEAGSEPFMGQVLVARVVMNRIKHGFEKNPCAVIYAKNSVIIDEQERVTCQFSWVCEGKETPVKNVKYSQAEDIARKVLTENAWSDIVPTNVLFFHNHTVKPKWNYDPVMTVGNHTFYSKKRDNKQ